MLKILFTLIGLYIIFWCILPLFFHTYNIGTIIGICIGLIFTCSFFLYDCFIYKLILAVFTLCLLAVIVRMIRACRIKPEGNENIIVLGAHFTKDHPSTIMQRRVDRAAAYLQAHPHTAAVLSGGQTEDEPYAEASAMAGLLSEKHIDRKRMRIEDRSLTTAENFAFSAPLIHGRTAIVTSEFHMYRAVCLAHLHHLNVCALPVRTPWKYLGIYFFRELAGIAVYAKNKRKQQK